MVATIALLGDPALALALAPACGPGPVEFRASVQLVHWCHNSLRAAYDLQDCHRPDTLLEGMSACTPPSGPHVLDVGCLCKPSNERACLRLDCRQVVLSELCRAPLTCWRPIVYGNYLGRNIFDTTLLYFTRILFWSTLFSFKFWFSCQLQFIPLMNSTKDLLGSVSLPDGQLGPDDTSLDTAAVWLAIVCLWVPSILNYFMDVQVWYFVWTSFTGLIKGLWLHLGEVRGLTMLRKRFLLLPEQFNNKILSGLHPGLDSPKDKSKGKGHLQARLLEDTGGPAEPASGDANKRDSSRNVAAKRGDRWTYFAMCWNEIIKSFREDDLLTNREMDLLRFRFAEGVGGLDVYLPVFLSAGMLDKVISQTRVYRGRWSDRWKAVAGREAEKEAELKLQTDELYTRVLGSTLMYEALQEIWETVAWILDSLLGEQHRESVRKIIALTHGYVKKREIFNRFKIDKDPSHDQASPLKEAIVGVVKALRDSISNMTKPETRESGRRGSVARDRRGSSIPAVPEDSDNLIESSPMHQRDINLVCEKLRNMFMVLSSFFNAKDEKVLVELDRIKLSPLGFFWNDQYVSDQLKILRDDPRTEAVLDRAEHLMTATKVDAEPQNDTAKRRLRFFVNSLFMDLPLAAPTMDMWSFTTLTPFYSEDIIFSLQELNKTNEDGVSVLFYLKVLYPDEWRNFLERVMPGKSDKDFNDACGSDPKKKLQLRLWASYRGQTLSRTVRGMMLYEKALKVLMSFEHPNKAVVEELVKLKFNYTVSCQIYGDQKKKRQPKADDTELLLRQYPNLRVAYIDEVKVLNEQV